MITITLDSSQITQYLDCKQKWNLAGREHLILSGAKTEALDRGTILHRLLEFYYLERFDKPVYQAAQAATDRFYNSSESKLMTAKDNQVLVLRFGDYVKHYASNDFQPVRLEGIPSVELGFSIVFYEDQDKRFVLEGKIDLLSLFSRSEMIFIDHKTQGRAMNLYPYSPQFLTYSMVTKIRRAVINYVRLHEKIDNTTFVRVPITFTEHQIENWRYQVFAIFHEIYEHTKLEQESGIVSPFPQNFGACSGPFKCNPCQFTHLCELNPMNLDMINNLKSFKYEKKVWEPWKPEEVKLIT